MRLTPILFVALSCLIAEQVADACSAPLCWPGYLSPQDGATVPANLPALYWRPTLTFDGAAPDPAMVTLETTTGPGAALALTATALPGGDYLLTPAQPLVAGTSYVLTDHTTCGGTAGPSITFHTAPSAASPAALGVLTSVVGEVGPLVVGTSGGSCSSEVTAAQATITLAIGTDALAWQDVLQFETRVDDRVWSAQGSINVRVGPGESWQGRAVDRVYRTCASDDPSAFSGLAAGPHVVTMRATVPGSPTVLMSNTVTVDLACPGDPLPDCAADPAGCDEPSGDGGGCSTGGSPGAPWLLIVLGALVARTTRRR